MPINWMTDYPFAKHTWLGVGGPAEYFAVVNSVSDLENFLKHNTAPVTVLGAGSNVLIRDGGMTGYVIQLGSEFQRIQVQGDTLLCGASVKMRQVANFARDLGWAGFEFMADIPGTIGGGLISNAGAFHTALSDLLVSVSGYNVHGESIQMNDFSNWGYRSCPITDVIFTAVILRPTGFASVDQIQSKMDEYHRYRMATQPQGVRTAGSTFFNPPGQSAGFLIEKSGLKGYKQNGAEMSSVHANFLINHESTGNQLEDFIQYVSDTVYQKQGIRLQREIKCLGKR